MTNYRLTATDVVVRTVDGLTIPSDSLNTDRMEYTVWLAAGNTPDPYVSTPVPVTILSQDLMAQFTSSDASAIQAAVAGNVQFWLLWSAMQAQKDPMLITNARFLSGWNALVTVLGQTRMNAIATSLGAPSLVV
jgi:hypothetical protein